MQRGCVDIERWPWVYKCKHGCSVLCGPQGQPSRLALYANAFKGWVEQRKRTSSDRRHLASAACGCCR